MSTLADGLPPRSTLPDVTRWFPDVTADPRTLTAPDATTATSEALIGADGTTASCHLYRQLDARVILCRTRNAVYGVELHTDGTLTRQPISAEATATDEVDADAVHRGRSFIREHLSSRFLPREQWTPPGNDTGRVRRLITYL